MIKSVYTLIHTHVRAPLRCLTLSLFSSLLLPKHSLYIYEFFFYYFLSILSLSLSPPLLLSLSIFHSLHFSSLSLSLSYA